MFDVLSKGFKSARLKLKGQTVLTEDNIRPALREVRTSLIQADVGLDVVKDFTAQVKKRCLGDVVQLKTAGENLTPDDHFIKACYDQMVDMMGPVDTGLQLTRRMSVILMVGLQGAGKTTTTGKIAKKLVAEGKKPLLVAADVYRPAAAEQLMVLGRQVGVPVFSIPGMKPVELCKQAVAQAKEAGRDVVIIDTAGRLAIDNALMEELTQIKSAVNPSDILFVVDAMMGQDAVRTAAQFDETLDFTGFILTKLDGDARGGAALSIKHVTGKPIKFLGQGEDLEKLEEFRPEGLAQRILGFGDVVGLMKDFEKHVDADTAQADAKKMLKGEFSYNDFVRQLQSVRKMGPLKELFARMPGISQLMDQIPDDAFDDKEMDRTLAIIDSMTKQERSKPSLLNESRFNRIAKGCGRSLTDVRDLHNRFEQARAMMKQMGGMMNDPSAMSKAQQMMGGGGFPGMGGGLPGMGGGGGFPGFGGGGGGFPGLGVANKSDRADVSTQEKIARRKKQRDARKARKKNR